MVTILPAHRNDLSKYAPRIETVQIPVDKIGQLIGPGGKNIKSIVAETGCEINIGDDGKVSIYSSNPEGMDRARQIIRGMTAEIEVGQTYQGRVVSTKDFGAFVEVLPGKDGLCHISELADFRVNRTEDVVKVGDVIWVKCIGIDDKGRVKLSRKVAMKERDELANGTTAPAESQA
jgi:polyribonucleotide nucleotidyltransferase